MYRDRREPRRDWQRIVEEQGLVYGTPARDGAGKARPYWDESVHYVFGMDEILSMEADVELLHSMCLDAVDHVVTAERPASGRFAGDVRAGFVEDPQPRADRGCWWARPGAGGYVVRPRAAPRPAARDG